MEINVSAMDLRKLPLCKIRGYKYIYMKNWDLAKVSNAFHAGVRQRSVVLGMITGTPVLTSNKRLSLWPISKSEPQLEIVWTQLESSFVAVCNGLTHSDILSLPTSYSLFPVNITNWPQPFKNSNYSSGLGSFHQKTTVGSPQETSMG